MLIRKKAREGSEVVTKIEVNHRFYLGLLGKPWKLG
jgi:hypothetical protein